MENLPVLFEQNKICRLYDKKTGAWFFSVIDIIQILIQQPDYQLARKYWNKLKELLSKEGIQSVTNCHRLNLQAVDGKSYLTDVANVETLLRIIQSVPSPRAEPIKLWLAKVGYERIQELSGPEFSESHDTGEYGGAAMKERWFQKQSEQEAFLDLVNNQGFILEECVCEAVSSTHSAKDIHKGEVFESPLRRGGGRVEIDLWIKSGNFVFDFESKRSDFDWVFLRNSEEKNDVHIISGPNKKVDVSNRVVKHMDCVAKQVIEVSEDPETLELLRGKIDKSQPVSGLVLRSKREDYVHSAIRQALFNTEVLINSQLNDASWSEAPHRVFIPVIVTNARLLSASYSKTNINNEARLTQFDDIKTVPFAAINHSEILFHGPDFRRRVLHVGHLSNDPMCVFKDHFKGTQSKTVFIVNKDHVTKFFETIILL